MVATQFIDAILSALMLDTYLSTNEAISVSISKTSWSTFLQETREGAVGRDSEVLSTTECLCSDDRAYTSCSGALSLHQHTPITCKFYTNNQIKILQCSHNIIQYWYGICTRNTNIILLLIIILSFIRLYWSLS